MRLARILQTSILLVVVLVFTTCRKEFPPNVIQPKTMDNLIIAEDFNWESSQQVHIHVGVNLSTGNIGKLCRISIFDGHPDHNGNLMATGAAGYDAPFEAEWRLPTALKMVYLKAENDAGIVLLDSLPVSSYIEYTFSQSLLKGSTGTLTDPNCSLANTSNTLSGNTVYNLSNGTNYYVTGSFNGTIHFSGSGATITVCGTMHPQSVTGMGSSCSIVVAPGGSLIYSNKLTLSNGARLYSYAGSTITLDDLTMNGSTTKVWNTSNNFTVNSEFTPNGIVENYGSMTFNNGVKMTSAVASFVAAGTMTIHGDLMLTSTLTNNGAIEIFGHLNINNGVLYNNCRFIVHEDLILTSGRIELNGGYFKTTQAIYLNNPIVFILKNKSMLSANNYYQNVTVTGTGGRSEIKVTGQGYVNGNNKVSGPIEMITNSGTLAAGNGNNFINGANLTSIANALNPINVSSCNPEGCGPNALPPDFDADGVPDNLDAFPNDPARAYYTYYPSQNVFGSLAYEDLWPSKGDYDMNDLVVNYRFRIVTNAQNNVVDLEPWFCVSAAGAGYKNGFGFQLDGILPAQISSVTGCSPQISSISVAQNGVENGQAKAVIIVFDNYNYVIHRHPNGGNYFNTDTTKSKGYSDTLKLNIHFATAVTQSFLGAPPYNPFLIKNMVRSVEIHLADHAPTSLANTALFNTGADNSIPASNRYYKTANNLPWALNLPVKFDYVIEKSPVIQGYNYFADWSESTGASFTDWYTNKNGYRTKNKIFH
jgi:LruC domain-containing protein